MMEFLYQNLYPVSVISSLVLCIVSLIVLNSVTPEEGLSVDHLRVKRFSEHSTAFFFILGFIFAFSPIAYEYNSSGTTLLRQNDNGEWTECKWGTWDFSDYVTLPTKDRHRSGNKRYNLNMFGTVTPITENPKARTIDYYFHTEISDIELYLSDPERRSKDVMDADVFMTQKAAYWLYEFNDKHSKDLALFYNPMDPIQKRKMKDLVEGYFNEKLGKYGLRIVFKSFSIS